MCGISAIISSGNSLAVTNIKQMSDIISHRGPDDEGFIVLESLENSPKVYGAGSTPKTVFESAFPYTPRAFWPEGQVLTGLLALGHRRLSIVDLSPAGHQPMCSHDKTAWITYNGEIYNFIEIKQELQTLGYIFQTQSDTEVILCAYRHWGVKCLERFNGMFAFVIVDLFEKKVFAARDRFGVKPLYYWCSPKGFVAFASEIKQFTCLPGWQPKMHGQRVYDFLNWEATDHTSDTLFQGVKQLRGGEMLELSIKDAGPAAIEVSRWYSLSAEPFKGSFQEAAEKFKQLMEEAVQLRLRADVDVGSCLSGGLDSSTIVCLANRQMRNCNASGKQKTFSACSNISRFDERHFIEIVVENTQVEAHYTYPCMDKLFDELPKICWHQDEPFTSTSIFAQWQVFQLVKEQGIKVMLDGQGADEQLAGYHGFFGHYFNDLFRSGKWHLLFQEIQQASQKHGINPMPHLLKTFIPKSFRQPLRKCFNKSSTDPNWLNIPLLSASKTEPYRFVRSLQAQSLLQLEQSSLPKLLHYEDRDSMAHSIESRTPFLDYRLVEFTYSLPSHFKIQQGMTKAILRESMKGVLPDPIRQRVDKIGFATAEEVWIREQHPERFKQAIDQAIESSQGVIHSDYTLKEVDAIISGEKPFSYFIWRLISFGEWIKTFSVKT